MAKPRKINPQEPTFLRRLKRARASPTWNATRALYSRYLKTLNALMSEVLADELAHHPPQPPTPPTTLDN